MSVILNFILTFPLEHTETKWTLIYMCIIYSREKKSTTDHDTLLIDLKSFFVQSSSGALHWTSIRRDDKNQTLKRHMIDAEKTRRWHGTLR